MRVGTCLRDTATGGPCAWCWLFLIGAREQRGSNLYKPGTNRAAETLGPGADAFGEAPSWLPGAMLMSMRLTSPKFTILRGTRSSVVFVQ